MFSFRHIAHTLASYRCVTPLVMTPALLMAGLVIAAETKPIYESPIVSAETKGHSVAIDVPLNGAKELYLVISDAGDGFGCDWADWVEPTLTTPQGQVKLTDLKWSRAESGFGQVQLNKSCGGDALMVAGVQHSFGIGTHANSLIAYKLPEGTTRFQARGAIDDGGANQGCGSTVKFAVYTQAPSPKATQATGGSAGSRELAKAVDQLDAGEGLEATLFAGEPMMLNPTNIDIDPQGRVWVCEVVNYRHHNGERPEGDRILILEDTNGDGVADKSTVFYQGNDVDSAHGICVLGDRVIISAGDTVFSLYDRNHDLKADPGSKEILFTGIEGKQHDHGIHAFVLGPDGKLYFNFGNSGRRLKDKDGKVVVDLSGREVHDHRKPYQEGMVFRCDLDGSNLETLGWNFRNNWEVCVDSFGSMWQSDNDDDGNRGVRINYVMEFGNYGYKDEFTGAGWQQPRTNIEAEIPLRHWHLNDPGVMPNLVQTGAGSPTGILFYEGKLLPEIFRNQIIHCDAGPNIVRAYVTKPDGAGYSAEMVNILEGKRDQWFRPSDVCVAPDGSLIIADWYDPGVGGHRAGDVEKGRLFRVAPPGTPYKFPKPDFSTVDGAMAQLASPNLSARSQAYLVLQKMGAQAEPALLALFETSKEPRLRARALGLLKKNPAVLQKALRDSDADIRIAALRLIRQVYSPVAGSKNTTVLTQAISQLASDPNPAVRRECLVALATAHASADDVHGKGMHVIPQKAELWSQIANQYQGSDRWYLEALGVGAEGDWDACLASYLKAHPNAAETLAGRDILWRSRSSQTPELLAKIISNPKTPAEELPRYFRAFDFLTAPTKDEAIAQLAFATQPMPDGRDKLILAEALGRLKSFDPESNPARKAALARVLETTRGTPAYITLVDRFNMQAEYPGLLALAKAQADSQLGVDAARVLVAKNQGVLIEAALVSKAPGDFSGAAILRAIGNAGGGEAIKLLRKLALDDKQPNEVRMEAIRGLAKSQQGAEQLINLAKEQKLQGDSLAIAGFAVQAANHPKLKSQVDAIFPPPPSRNNSPLPPLAQLIKNKGSVAKGREIYFGVGTCAKCHQVGSEGKDVGPALTEIGSKLSREAMFESILYPSAGISHNYESFVAELSDGTSVIGLLLNQTDQEVSLKSADGLIKTVKRSDIEELTKQKISLMPADLQKLMTAQELVDLVEYLQTLKKTGN
ncbi:NPCBM/NEW2 domain protein [Planctopirus ephydatiae]|uniref:NPCBM/NEW2 domain protein n=1 Tax=Planctopirus ephydatiae TaxID=2528019 RepID=A0A518GJX6_9PLAN|nr:PVC-type heme-binding CxxCH protein [Planctopirus ephydatiae]QDV28896.1 NPCBM/NEW2 domain protein [Planctopirus ephydatiae]